MKKLMRNKVVLFVIVILLVLLAIFCYVYIAKNCISKTQEVKVLEEVQIAEDVEVDEETKIIQGDKAHVDDEATFIDDCEDVEKDITVDKNLICSKIPTEGIRNDFAFLEDRPGQYYIAYERIAVYLKERNISYLNEINVDVRPTTLELYLNYALINLTDIGKINDTYIIDYASADDMTSRDGDKAVYRCVMRGEHSTVDVTVDLINEIMQLNDISDTAQEDENR